MSHNYIPSPHNLKTGFIFDEYPDIYKPADKIPIDKIKVDKKKLSFANDVRESDVNEIVKNFHIEGWEPIFITPDYFLIDGQHRLAASKRMKLKFIDVVFIHDNLLN